MGTRICQGGDIESAEGPTEGGGRREEGLQQHGCKHTQPHRYVHTCRSSTGNQMTQQQLHLRPPLASLHIAGSLSFLYMHPSPQTHTCALPPPPQVVPVPPTYPPPAWTARAWTHAPKTSQIPFFHPQAAPATNPAQAFPPRP